MSANRMFTRREAKMEALALILSNVIAVAAAIFALYQAKAAQKAVKQASLIKLFSTFDLASQATIDRPELLQSVHGLDESIVLWRI
jgi:hypothetical protein